MPWSVVPATLTSPDTSNCIDVSIHMDKWITSHHFALQLTSTREKCHFIYQNSRVVKDLRMMDTSRSVVQVVQGCHFICQNVVKFQNKAVFSLSEALTLWTQWLKVLLSTAMNGSQMFVNVYQFAFLQPEILLQLAICCASNLGSLF